MLFEINKLGFHTKFLENAVEKVNQKNLGYGT